VKGEIEVHGDEAGSERCVRLWSHYIRI